MRRVDLARPKTLFIIRLVLPLICSFILTADLGKAAASSMDEHSAKLVEGAKREGQLSWYVSFGLQDAQAVMKGFNNKYPFLKTSIYRAGDETLLTRVMAEVRAKRYLFDVVQMGGINAATLAKKGLLARYASPERKFYPEGWKDQEGLWTSVNIVLNVIGYNTKLIPPKEAPKSWKDLLDPKWKGTMALDDKAFYWFGGMLKMMGEEKGLEYMKKLSQQDIYIRRGRTLIGQLIAAGERSIGIAVYNHTVEQMKALGAPIEWVAVDGIVPGFNHVGVFAHANHPNAAKLFVDYYLSREGQEIIAGLQRIPTRIDVDPTVPKLKRGLNIMPFDLSIVDDYEKYMKLYRGLFLNK